MLGAPCFVTNIEAKVSREVNCRSAGRMDLVIPVRICRWCSMGVLTGVYFPFTVCVSSR